MLDNFLADEEKTGGNLKVVSQKDAENIMDSACEQRGSFHETERARMLRIRIRQLTFLTHIMKKDGLEKGTLTGQKWPRETVIGYLTSF